MWKINIILLAIVVACSADTGDSLEDVYDEITASIDWEKEINGTKTTDVQECEIPHVSAEVGQCVKKSLCAVAVPTVDKVASFVIRSPSTGLRTKRDLSKGSCGWMEVCCSVHNIISPTTKPPLPDLGCGYSNPGALRGLDDKATSAQYADFPWMVALMVKSNKPAPTFTDEYIGGGTIIHPTVVMTVAHKVAGIRDPSLLKCRAGEWDREISMELYPHQDREVARIIVHEEYNKVHLYYDIALLKLKSAYNLINAPHIGVACLEKTLPPAGTVCYSMGWGKDMTNNMTNAKVLKKVTLPLVARDVCEKRFKLSLSSRYTLHKTLTCAGGEAGVDTCVGDGGAPLVCQIPDKNLLRYSVVGMVMYGLPGVKCGAADAPAAYSNVPELYDWVAKQMKMTLKIKHNTFEY